MPVFLRFLWTLSSVRIADALSALSSFPIFSAASTAVPTTATTTVGPALLLQNVVSDASVRNVQWLSSRLGSATYDANEKLSAQVEAMAAMSSMSAAASPLSSVEDDDDDEEDGDSYERRSMKPGASKPRKERQRILRLAMSQLEKDRTSVRSHTPHCCLKIRDRAFAHLANALPKTLPAYESSTTQ
jgi:hypothetical protein